MPIVYEYKSMVVIYCSFDWGDIKMNAYMVVAYTLKFKSEAVCQV